MPSEMKEIKEILQHAFDLLHDARMVYFRMVGVVAGFWDLHEGDVVAAMAMGMAREK